jgi:uncharacterized protein with HEPN domain
MQPRGGGGPGDLVRFQHMLAGAAAAVRFAQSRARAELDSDEMLRRALVNAVQEIGEAAARVTDGGRARALELPWGQFVEMRNILVHVYWGVDYDQLWKAVAEDIPQLLRVVERVIACWEPAD